MLMSKNVNNDVSKDLPINLLKQRMLYSQEEEHYNSYLEAEIEMVRIIIAIY